MNDMTGTVVIITGASGNLGSAAAEAFEAAGARLVLVDRASGAVENRRNDGRGGHLVVGGIDLTRPGDADRVMRCTIDAFGHVDAVLNIVGAYRGGKNVADDSWDTWQFCIDTNVRTAFEMSRAAARVLSAQGSGCIINIGSRNAFAGPAGFAAYSAAKSAVLRMTESLADELRPRGVRVNCIVPGTLDTAANRQSMPNAPESRFVSARAVAEVALFLVSDAARSVSGVAVPVYGCVSQPVAAM